jgi:hypothetical protein
LLTVGWIVLAGYAWGYDHEDPRPIQALAVVAGIVLLVLWLTLIYRIIRARYGHYYRLTSRRLFVSTGLYTRRRDQVELMKINDVYTQQKLIERWLSLGTVVVKSTDPTFRRASCGGERPERGDEHHLALRPRRARSPQRHGRPCLTSALRATWPRNRRCPGPLVLRVWARQGDIGYAVGNSDVDPTAGVDVQWPR